MRRMLEARLTPASRFLPSSVSRNFDSASTRFDDHQQVVLVAEREDGIDQVMALALLLEIDLQAVGEEGEEIVAAEG